MYVIQHCELCRCDGKKANGLSLRCAPVWLDSFLNFPTDNTDLVQQIAVERTLLVPHCYPRDHSCITFLGFMTHPPSVLQKHVLCTENRKKMPFLTPLTPYKCLHNMNSPLPNYTVSLIPHTCSTMISSVRYRSEIMNCITQIIKLGSALLNLVC